MQCLPLLRGFFTPVNKIGARRTTNLTVKQSYLFQQFLVVELSYKVNVCCYFTNVSNIALSTCLWLVSVVLEKIQVAKSNHLRVKLKDLFHMKVVGFGRLYLFQYYADWT